MTAVMPAFAHAQTVRGAVADAGDQPVPGVVVMLVDSTSRVAARALSDQRGEFRLTADGPGTYRLRTLRIGYRPITSEPLVLAAGGEVTRRIVLSSVPVALDGIRIVDRSECRAFSDSAASTFAVWEQIRAALTAAQLTEASRAISSTTVVYDRTLDAAGGKVLRQRSSVSTNVATRAWRTPPPDVLRRAGYVVTEKDNTVDYYAPGFDALLSNIFVEDHCFRLTTDRKQPALIGMLFEPTPERKKIAEIRGTLWVDRASAELRRLELRYVNVSSLQEDRAGAELDFMRLRDGTWAVSRWNIRMPLIERFVIPGHGGEDRVTSMQVSGGTLVLARRGSDTLWSQPARAVAGVVLDSASNRPVGGARIRETATSLEATSDARGRFTIGGIIPGEHTLEVRTPSLDSINTAYPLTFTVTDADEPLELRVPSAAQFSSALCGSNRGEGAGIIVGRVVFGDSTSRRPLGGAHIVAEWSLDSARVQRAEVQSMSDGSFRLCRLPVGAALMLNAANDSAESAGPTTLRLSRAARLARAELVVESKARLALRGAVFAGIVVFDSTRAPIVGAEISLPDIGKTTLSDENGRFRITGVAPGDHQIVVRRIGYGAADTHLTFHANATVERRIVLGRAVTLEPVVVSDVTLDLAMRSFEENRRVGLGHFITRAELAKLEGVSVASILEGLPGATIIRGRGGSWVRSNRIVSFTGAGPDAEDMALGAPPAACYSQVYLDNTLVFSGRIIDGHFEPLFNLNSINPAQIEAIEFYASPAEAPLKYSRMESHCGVVVIWTRRSP